MNYDRLFQNPDFGGVHIQRFDDSPIRRVHVLSSNTCNTPRIDERGIAYNDPSVDVMTDEEIPAAIEKGWKRLQLLWHFGRTGRMNALGLFFHDPIPPELECAVECPPEGRSSE